MSSLSGHIHRFSDFAVDIEQRVLLREGKAIPLAPKVFETLLALVENHGRILVKEELMKRPWPDTFVEESNLTFNIQQLRKALGDNARKPVYIETIPRRGYRFIAAIEPPSSSHSEVHDLSPNQMRREGDKKSPIPPDNQTAPAPITTSVSTAPRINARA